MCSSTARAEVYGSMGIARECKVRHAAAVLRNFEFFVDPDFPTNKLNIGREAVEKNVVFLDR
jgi:hypothetical protein